MRTRLGDWWKKVLQKRWWLVYIAVYKVLEDRSLGWFNSQIDQQAGGLLGLLRGVFSKLPWITWLAIPFIVIALLIMTWRDSRNQRQNNAGITADASPPDTVVQQYALTISPLADNEPIKLNGFEFYPSRDALRLHRPLLKQLRSAAIIWAVWNTGAQARTDDAVNQCNIEQLVLPHPDSPYIELLASTVSHDSADALRSDIRAITRQMLDKREEQIQSGELGARRVANVRWYRGLIGNSITIGDPLHMNPNTWILVEVLGAETAAPGRPSFIIWRQPFNTLFDNVFQSYQRLWLNSEEPTL
ncbi:MAG: hypothetical protein HY533_01955 [Chloroflexi bacterium]|nr:hypothetical protein [Chloroflexota bacterium]